MQEKFFSGLKTAVEILLREFKKRGFKQSCIALLLARKYHRNQFRKGKRLYRRNHFRKGKLLACKYHRNHFRKGKKLYHRKHFRKGKKPYLWHPIRMAQLALMFPGITDDMVATILLHDVIEETHQKDRLNGDSSGIRLDRAGYADMIARSLPIKSSIRESVILLTTLPASNESPEQKIERKEAYFANIYGRLESIVTKLFDRTDNLLDAPGKLSREAIIKNLIETDRQLIPAALRAEEKYPDGANLIRVIRIILKCLTCVLAPIYGVELDIGYPLPDKLDKDSLGRYINKQLAAANCQELSKKILAILTRRIDKAIDAAILQESQHPHQEK